MFVDDMSLEQAQEWEQRLVADLDKADKGLLTANRPGTQEYRECSWDLEDVRRRINDLGQDTGDYDAPHTGHYSRLGGTYWCDTCNSPYCDNA